MPIELFIGAQFDPQLDFVALVVGHHPAHGDLLERHAHAGADFAFDDLGHLRQPSRRPQVVDEDHRRPMVASRPMSDAQASPASPILQALYRGQRDEAQALLAAASADKLSIHEAAAMGSLDRLEQILAADATQANAWAEDGFQPLGLAAFFGQRQAVEVLLANGADVNTPARNAFQVTALHAALAGPDPEIARVLVPAGADVNARQQGGVTPLQEAAFSGRLELARLLLEHGAERAATDDKGQTAADMARAAGHRELVQLLENV
jgi:uncharacterized protein